MIDLDGLKHINDTYGHEFGDKYIQIAADVFMDSVPDGTVVSRPGGEPFPLHLSAGVAWYPQDTTDSKIFMQMIEVKIYIQLLIFLLMVKNYYIHLKIILNLK